LPAGGRRGERMRGTAVARPKGRPKLSKRDDVPVKVGLALGGKAKLVATYRGVSVAALFTEMLGGPVGRVYVRMVRDREGTTPPKL
jgi:hypothetical protein